MRPRLTDMHPELLTRYIKWATAMQEAGILFALTCVIRTQAEQDALYSQGREPLDAVNAMRMTAGMTALPADLGVTLKGVRYAYAQTLDPQCPAYGALIVTKTQNSRHKPDKNGHSRAFDYCILKGDRKPTWDIKFDADADNVPDYLEAAELGRACGLDCGAFWKGWKDWPHMQIPDGIL